MTLNLTPHNIKIPEGKIRFFSSVKKLRENTIKKSYKILDIGDGANGGLQEFNLILDGNKISYFSFNIKKDKKDKKKKKLKLYYIGTSNGKKYLDSIKESAPYLYNQINELDNIQVKGIGKKTFHILIEYIKKNTNYNEFVFESLNEKSSDFYNYILPLLKKEKIIENFYVDGKKYLVKIS